MKVETTTTTEKPISLAPRTYAVALGLFLVIAAWVRWQYAREISLFVDEFTTMWAAKRILELGVPRMPSGVLYTRGILASYVEAAFLAYRYDPLIARIPSILFALATIITIYHVGRRQFGARVGLVAAALMVLAPEEIIWGARARFYMQLQLFVLLTAWVTYAALRAQDPRRRARLHVWFVVLFVLALFSQEETILLYPALVAAIVAWRGLRFFRHPDTILAHVGAWVAMGVRYIIEKVGQPGYFETIQARRPYVGLIFDIRGAWEEYGPFFYEPARLVLTLFVLVALVMALREARRAWRFDSWRACVLDGCEALRTIGTSYQATLYYLWLFGSVFAVILLFVGQTWREMRYIFMIVPFWFLPAAAGIVWTWDRLVRSPRLREQGTLVLAVVAMCLFIPDAVRTLRQQVEGYDLALAYIAEHRQPGDAVLTPQPPACAAVFGPCDYYAIQKDYEEYVIRRDGVWVDRWTGAPLLNTVDQLEEVIRTHPHTYFLVDGYRLATRYEPDFVRMVVEQMDVVFMDRGIAVLRADGWREVPPRPIVHTYEPPVNFKNEMGLRRVELSGDHVMPGEQINAMLAWTALGKVWDEYNVFFHLEAPDGSLLAQDDAPPVDGVMPTWLFHIGDQPEYPDEHTLTIPADAPAGRYRLQTGLYLLDTLERLPILNEAGEPAGDAWTIDYIWVGERPPLPPVVVDARFEEGLTLVARSDLPPVVKPGETLAITLAWRADAPQPRDYTFFVQLLNEEGVLVAQNDRPPEGGFYPTTAWDVGDVVQDTYQIALPDDLPPGSYRLIAGAYWWQTGERLHLPDGSDVVLLGTVEVEAP